MEMAIGKYPIPPPTPEDLAAIFGPNAIAEHMEAAKTGKALSGKFFLYTQPKSSGRFHLIIQ